MGSGRHRGWCGTAIICTSASASASASTSASSLTGRGRTADAVCPSTRCCEIFQAPRTPTVTRVYEVRRPTVVGRVPHLDVLRHTRRCGIGRRRCGRGRGRGRGRRRRLRSEIGCAFIGRRRYSFATHHGRVLSRIVRANAAHCECYCRARKEKRANINTQQIAGAKPKREADKTKRDSYYMYFCCTCTNAVYLMRSSSSSTS